MPTRMQPQKDTDSIKERCNKHSLVSGDAYSDENPLQQPPPHKLTAASTPSEINRPHEERCCDSIRRAMSWTKTNGGKWASTSKTHRQKSIRRAAIPKGSPQSLAGNQLGDTTHFSGDKSPYPLRLYKSSPYQLARTR